MKFKINEKATKVLEKRASSFIQVNERDIKSGDLLKINPRKIRNKQFKKEIIDPVTKIKSFHDGYPVSNNMYTPGGLGAKHFNLANEILRGSMFMFLNWAAYEYFWYTSQYTTVLYSYDKLTTKTSIGMNVFYKNTFLFIADGIYSLASLREEPINLTLHKAMESFL